MNVKYLSPPHGGRACSAASEADADRQLHPTRRTPDRRVRRIVRSAAGSAVGVSVTTPAALESQARQSGDNSAVLEWLTLELHSVAVLVEWLGQANKVVANGALSIEWAALPAPVRVSLERLLTSPGKRRILSTPGRLRLLKRL
jgi:hypothetical protein